MSIGVLDEQVDVVEPGRRLLVGEVVAHRHQHVVRLERVSVRGDEIKKIFHLNKDKINIYPQKIKRKINFQSWFPLFIFRTILKSKILYLNF